MPFCVGLTGGIGSGKSTAAKMFRELGAAVVDTDEISRELTAADGGAMAAIRAQFGPGYVAADGSLDRDRMRRLVFGDAGARKKLEAILHPLIRAAARARVAAASAAYVILVVPLLFETGACLDLANRVLVVDCSEARQIERATRRSGISADEVRAIMASQLARAARIARADDVLDNDAGIEALRRRVGELHAIYLTLARGA
ncbi:MAG: dephospho-CoA kinase [Betaproteobacteria bacterium]|nr:dephospho-CoA kinase [Betaproteobacteria bacterium]